MNNSQTHSHLAQNHFWSKVAVGAADECWFWTGALNSRGYGTFHWNGRSFPAHRASWAIANGPIPPGEGYHGTCVCHTCDVPSCVNPKHLWIGTCAQNNTDRSKKGRDADRKGEKHVLAKLTNKQVLEIRRRYAVGDISQQRLANEFGVTQTNVGHIVRHEHWTNIKGASPRKRKWAKHAVPRKRDRFGHFAPW